MLLGTDLVKDPGRLCAAYDDASGVTAEFNLNVLRRLNSELGADFDLDRFAHIAHWDHEGEWVEMRLRAQSAQTVHINALDMTVDFAPDEELRTEISVQVPRRRRGRRAGGRRLETIRWWTDDDADCGLSMSVLR